MIDCRKLDSTDRDKNLEIHVGRSSRIMKSILGSKDYQELHSHLLVGISRFLSTKNVMICENCCCNSVPNAELWSSTLSRYGRYLHSVSLMNLSKRDFWKDTCAGKCSECRRQSSKTFQIHYDCVRAECSRLAAAIGSETEHWKRPRRESHGQSTLLSSGILNKKPSAIWRSDSGTFTKALMHCTDPRHYAQDGPEYARSHQEHVLQITGGNER